MASVFSIILLHQLILVASFHITTNFCILEFISINLLTSGKETWASVNSKENSTIFHQEPFSETGEKFQQQRELLQPFQDLARYPPQDLIWNGYWILAIWNHVATLFVQLANVLKIHWQNQLYSTPNQNNKSFCNLIICGIILHQLLHQGPKFLS